MIGVIASRKMLDDIFWPPGCNTRTWRTDRHRATAKSALTHSVCAVKKNASPYVLPCRIWSFSVKECKHKYMRTPKIGEPSNSALLRWEAWLTQRYTPLPTCYHVKFGSSATKSVRINRGNPKNWGALRPRTLRVGTWHDPLKCVPLSRMLSCRIWSF